MIEKTLIVHLSAFKVVSDKTGPRSGWRDISLYLFEKHLSILFLLTVAPLALLRAQGPQNGSAESLTLHPICSASRSPSESLSLYSCYVDHPTTSWQQASINCPFESQITQPVGKLLALCLTSDEATTHHRIRPLWMTNVLNFDSPPIHSAGLLSRLHASMSPPWTLCFPSPVQVACTRHFHILCL
jgi:hypothetical protein